MSRWNMFRSKPKKSVKELQEELSKLKEAKKNIEDYEKLEAEKKAIQQDIKREGFKIRHEKALKILGQASSVMKNIDKELNKKK